MKISLPGDPTRIGYEGVHCTDAVSGHLGHEIPTAIRSHLLHQDNTQPETYYE